MGKSVLMVSVAVVNSYLRVPDLRLSSVALTFSVCFSSMAAGGLFCPSAANVGVLEKYSQYQSCRAWF